MKKIFMIILLIISGFACNKDNENEIKGIVKDFTGIDGCGMIIILDNGSRIEPIQLPENTVLIPDARVQLKYEEIAAPSICMIGITVKITQLRYL